MAYTSAPLTAKQIADYNNDYPILVGNNAFDFHHLFEALWTVGNNSNSTGSDVTSASFPFYHAAGRDASTVSKTTGIHDTHWMHFDPVGAFTSAGCGFAPTPVVTPNASGDLVSIRPGMFVADKGTARYILRGTKVLSVGGSDFTMDAPALIGSFGHDLTLTGKPEADKAVFDSLFVFNHNMYPGVTPGFSGMSFRVRDHQTATGVVLGGAFQAVPTPLVVLMLDNSGGVGPTPYKYTDVEAASLGLYTPAINTTTGYYAGSVWAGERWQLPRWPDKPYDDKGTHSGAADHVGLSGFMTRQSTWRGRAFRRWSIPLSTDEDIAGCKLFQRGCGYFTKPFVLVETPKTNPRAYIMQAESAAVVFPRTGKHEQVFNINMVEKPPFYSTY